MATAATRRTRCCIVGGGPAGVMLGLLLGRAGVNVVVLEVLGLGVLPEHLSAALRAWPRS